MSIFRFIWMFALFCFLFSFNRTWAEENRNNSDIDEQARLGIIADRQEQFEVIVDTIGSRGLLNVRVDRETTFVLGAAFGDGWLIRLESFPEKPPEWSSESFEYERALPQLLITRSRFVIVNHNASAIPSDTVPRHTRMTNDNYSIRIPQADFDQVFDVISAVVNNETMISKNLGGCLDGTTFFVEVLVDKQRKLISRHNCDEDYKAVLRKLYPLVELAEVNLNPVGNDFRKIWINETTE